MSLVLASTGAKVKAVVVVAAAYAELAGSQETPPMTYIRELNAPILILHSTSDRTVAVAQARGYEATVAMLEKPYEAYYALLSLRPARARSRSFLKSG